MSVGFLDRLDGQLAVPSEVFERSVVATTATGPVPGPARAARFGWGRTWSPS